MQGAAASQKGALQFILEHNKSLQESSCKQDANATIGDIAGQLVKMTADAQRP